MRLIGRCSLWTQNKQVVTGIRWPLVSTKDHAKFCTTSGKPVENVGPPWRIMFFGTDEYSLAHLKVLHRNMQDENQTLVKKLEVTVTDEKFAVEKYASEEGLTRHFWPISPPHSQFDLGVIVSFGHLLPADIINAFPCGILNVHPSILPKWRGAAPMPHSILAGEKETAVTVMDIAASQFDVGPILVQEKFDIPENCITPKLEKLAAQHGGRLLLHCLRHLKTIERKRQEGKSSHAKKLNNNNKIVNWEKQTAGDVDRQYRALYGLLGKFSFSLRTSWNGRQVKLQDMLSPAEMQDPVIQNYLRIDEERIGDMIRPGFPIYHKVAKVLCIRCKTGWAGFKTVVFGKPMSAADFHSGHLHKHKDVLFDSGENGLDRYWGR